MAQTWAFVQDDTNRDDSGSPATTLAKAFTSNVTAGNHIFVAFGWGDVDQVPTCADSLGNTYTLIRKTWSTGRNQGWATWYAQNISGGANTVTCTISSQPYRRLYIRETSGLATTASLDVETGQTQAEPGTGANAVSSGALTTTAADDCLIAVSQDIASLQTTYAAGTNFTGRESIAGVVGGSEDRNCATTGSYSGTFTCSVGSDFITHAAAFKQAVAAATYMPPQRLFQRVA